MVIFNVHCTDSFLLWDYWFVKCDCNLLYFCSNFYFFKREDEGWTDYCFMVIVAWSHPPYREKTHFCLMTEWIHVLTETWNNLRDTESPQIWCLKLTPTPHINVISLLNMTTQEGEMTVTPHMQIKFEDNQQPKHSVQLSYSSCPLFVFFSAVF